MRRDEYLADDRVAGFTRWASQLVTGEVPLQHRWNSRNRSFCCTNLYDALVKYRWPENRHALDHRATAQQLRQFRDVFRDVGIINSSAKQNRFVANAEDIIKWGGIPVPGKLQEWRRMPPRNLQALIEQTKRTLDPQTSEMHHLKGFRYMGSGFSKIYSLLIDGFPIYDSRVACALACLVRTYTEYQKVEPQPDPLTLRTPPQRQPKSPEYLRCNRPRMYGNTAAYAEANLKAAWLLQEMVRRPGKFANVEGFTSVEALQHALFMVGYARLPDDALSAV